MTLTEAKESLKIDHNDEDNFIQLLIPASEAYIDSMVGEAYKTDVKAMSLAKILQFKIITDMYENRSTTVQEKTKQDIIVTSIFEKLANIEVV